MVVEGNVAVVVDVGAVPEDAGDGFSTLRCPSGTWDVWGVVVAVTATTQRTGFNVDAAVAVAAAAAVVAAAVTAYLGEDVGDECDEKPEAKGKTPH